MTAEKFIAEGRRIQRPCVLLRPTGAGEPVAIWYERDEAEIVEEGHRCWLTVKAESVPGLPSDITGFLSLFTNEENLDDGRVEISASWPKRAGIKLYAQSASVLPSIDDVFLHGSVEVEKWLKLNGWERGWAYNGNFKDKAVTDAYWKELQKECPLYLDTDIYAVLGGSNTPLECIELLEERLAILTLRDSEPWVEAWYTRAGEFKVFQRIT